MNKDGVSVGFEIILEEIQDVEDDLRNEGALAFGKGEYDTAKQISESGKKLSQFREKLLKLSQDWNAGIDSKTKSKFSQAAGYTIKKHKKGPRKNLRVTFPNGEVVENSTASMTMVKVIEFLNPEKVKKLNLSVSGVPLVSVEKHDKYGQSPLGKYLICTHSNTPTKKKVLEQAAKMLHQKISIEIV